MTRPVPPRCWPCGMHSHNILYAVANSNVYMTEQDAGSISWETVFYLCLAAVIVVLAVCEWITIRRYRSRKQQS